MNQPFKIHLNLRYVNGDFLKGLKGIFTVSTSGSQFVIPNIMAQAEAIEETLESLALYSLF